MKPSEIKTCTELADRLWVNISIWCLLAIVLASMAFGLLLGIAICPPPTTGLLATTAMAQVVPDASDAPPNRFIGDIDRQIEYVPGIVDTDRRHFREMLVHEWKAYQSACKTDSFLLPTGFFTAHPDTANMDSFGRLFRFTTTPDSAWVHWDRYSFPEFMLWIERSAK